MHVVGVGCAVLRVAGFFASSARIGALCIAGAGVVACGARTELDSANSGAEAGAADSSTPATDSAGTDAAGADAAPCVAAELARGLNIPTAIALDESFVYWLEIGDSPAGSAPAGSLSRCAKAGCAGAPILLASSLPAAESLVVDDRRLYWAEGPTGGLQACDKGACSPTALIHSAVDPGAEPVYLALDAETVFFTSIQGVGSCAKTGCTTPTVLATLETPGAEPLAVDDANVYFIDGPAVRACSKPTCAGGPSTLATGFGQLPSGIGVGEGAIYVTTGGAASAPDEAGGVFLFQGGSMREVATGMSHPTQVAVDGPRVYWIAEGTAGVDFADGAVEYCPKHGCDTHRPRFRRLASHQALPAALAVDVGCVYWVDDGAPFGPGNGSLRRAGK